MRRALRTQGCSSGSGTSSPDPGVVGVLDREWSSVVPERTRELRSAVR
jgi:hypothetical protein